MDLGAPRWDGRRGRIEVWYATFTLDGGTGGWLHHETVAPMAGDRAPYAHGWAAVFPEDGPPVVAGFGPKAVEPGDGWFRCDGVVVGPGRLTGSAGELGWDLTFTDDGPPLFTFPELAWRRDLLPGAQVVPWPRATFRGTFAGHPVDGAVGAVARIHGHGNAERWGWLHADLGGGAVLEIVTATPRRPGLRHLPALAQVQLRRPGRADWPRHPLAASIRFRTQFTERGFNVTGRGLRVEVDLPADRTVRLQYVDPDGATAVCTNSERADATVVAGPDTWHLRGTAHAEVGDRRSVA